MKQLPGLFLLIVFILLLEVIIWIASGYPPLRESAPVLAVFVSVIGGIYLLLTVLAVIAAVYLLIRHRKEPAVRMPIQPQIPQNTVQNDRLKLAAAVLLLLAAGVIGMILLR